MFIAPLRLFNSNLHLVNICTVVLFIISDFTACSSLLKKIKIFCEIFRFQILSPVFSEQISDFKPKISICLESTGDEVLWLLAVLWSEEDLGLVLEGPVYLYFRNFIFIYTYCINGAMSLLDYVWKWFTVEWNALYKSIKYKASGRQTNLNPLCTSHTHKLDL